MERPHMDSVGNLAVDLDIFLAGQPSEAELCAACIRYFDLAQAQPVEPTAQTAVFKKLLALSKRHWALSADPV